MRHEGKNERKEDPSIARMLKSRLHFTQVDTPEGKIEQHQSQEKEEGETEYLAECFIQSSDQLSLLVSVSGKISAGSKVFAFSKSMEA